MASENAEIDRPPPGVGIPWIWKRLDQLIQAVNALRKITFKEGREWKLTWTASNAVLTYVPGSGGGTAAPPADFSLYPAGSGLLGIRNGTVGGVRPRGMVAGGSPAFTVRVSGAGEAWLATTVNPATARITGVAIGVGGSLPNPTATVGIQSLGSYAVGAGGAVSIGEGLAGIGSQGFISCGGQHQFWSA